MECGCGVMLAECIHLPACLPGLVAHCVQPQSTTNLNHHLNHQAEHHTSSATDEWDKSAAAAMEQSMFQQQRIRELSDREVSGGAHITD